MKNLLLILPLLIFFSCAEEKINTLEDRIQKLETDVLILEIKFNNNPEESVLIKIGSEESQVIKYNMGYMSVSLNNLEKYANGSKATIKFGNISNIKLMDVSFTVDWGRLGEYDFPDYKTIKTKEVSLTEHLESGSWNYEKIILEDFPYDSLGFIRITNLHCGRISLIVRK